MPSSVHYDWLYRGNPHGAALTWVAVDRSDSRIVGSTSSFPRRMRFDALIQELEGAFAILTERDSEAMNWRYFRKPTKSVEILFHEEGGRVDGFAAMEFNPDRCFVFDFACRNEPAVIDTMTAGLVRAALARDSPLVTFEATAHGPYAELGQAILIKGGPWCL